MKPIFRYFLYSFVPFSLLACGGGSSDSPSSSPSSDSGSSYTFKDITIPSGFTWKSSESKEITFRVVSNFSTQNGVGVNVNGRHILKMYSVSSSGVDSQPFYTGRTDQTGKLTRELQLSSNWEQIKVVASVDGTTCTQQASISTMTSEMLIGCDVTIGSD
ncbi:hypothetical protein [Vibrio nigripulchritudo]|uniref:hypothetical protein n=1 Tax=Vibrio nigripulchritudo TaxID=28173 RepID=UPI0003B20C5C|nr:hypothetical protein [Vibrio nigripulchritudo]CCN68978.1 conserved hypothetical protein [Vibrio nigripulchritudo SFn118]